MRIVINIEGIGSASVEPISEGLGPSTGGSGGSPVLDAGAAVLSLDDVPGGLERPSASAGEGDIDAGAAPSGPSDVTPTGKALP